jgi:hypothetical protein
MKTVRMRRAMALPLYLLLFSCDPATAPTGGADFAVLARSAGEFAQAQRGQNRVSPLTMARTRVSASSGGT